MELSAQISQEELVGVSDIPTLTGIITYDKPIQGPAGAAGVGVPIGGTTGQVLAKNSNTDYDTEWITGGGASSWGAITGTLADQEDLNQQLIDNLDGDGGYYFTNTASDLGAGRLAMTKEIPPGGGASVSVTGAIDNQEIATFVTVSGYPNVTSLPSGTTSFHVQASQTAGTKVTRLYAEFYSRTILGVSTLISTSGLSQELTGSPALVSAYIPIEVVKGLGLTDRLMVTIKASISGAGTDPDITLNTQGNTSSRCRFPYEIDRTSIGLGNVDNTSDADKPISDDTQDALDLKQDLISAIDLQFIYQNDSGIKEGAPGYFLNGLGGIQFDKTATPNNLSGQSFHNFNLDITPLQNSPDETYGFLNLNANSNSAAFTYGTNGRAISFLNPNFSHTSDKDIGEVTFLNSYFNLGNGTDAIDVRGFSYSYGFGNINANVNISQAMQGYGFQPAFHASATVSSSTYVGAFYDSLSAAGVAFPNYTSFNSSPTLGSIVNNSNYTGALFNPTIPVFSGNAGANIIAIAGNYGTFGTGGWQGVNISPTVTNGQYVAGLNINMSNSTGTNVKAIDVVGDVNIVGALAFTGALSMGQLNAFYSANPFDGGGNPLAMHGLVTEMIALDSVTTANCDAIGVNTAMLIRLEDNSVNTSGAFGLGFTALALPCVVETHTGSSLDFMSGATFAINLSGSSTGGTIDTVKLARTVGIPNGITTINNLRGFQFDLPFGDPGTITHGFYTQVACHNYFAGNLVIGELTEVATNSSVGLEISSVLKAFLNARMTTTERDALTAVNGMQIYNSTLDKLQVYAAGSWVDLH